MQVQTVQDSSEVIFKTGTLDVAKREALNDMFVENFAVDRDRITSETISSTISSEMKSDTILAVAVQQLPSPGTWPPGTPPWWPCRP